MPVDCQQNAPSNECGGHHGQDHCFLSGAGWDVIHGGDDLICSGLHVVRNGLDCAGLHDADGDEIPYVDLHGDDGLNYQHHHDDDLDCGGHVDGECSKYDGHGDDSDALDCDGLHDDDDGLKSGGLYDDGDDDLDCGSLHDDDGDAPECGGLHDADALDCGGPHDDVGVLGYCGPHGDGDG